MSTPSPHPASHDRPPRRPPAPSRARRSVPTWRLARWRGTEILLSPSWLVIAVLIAVAVAPYVEDVHPGAGSWAYLIGGFVAVALYAAILVHEASHVIVARAYGHTVPSITLGFMGGRTAVDGEAGTPGEEALVAVVGPVASILIGVVALAAYAGLPSGGLVALVVFAVAWSNIGLGLMNLAPVLPLDGGRLLKALVWRLGGSVVLGTSVAAWAARVLAVAVVVYAAGSGLLWGERLPVLDLVVAVVIAVFLWASATAELQGARLRGRFARLVAADVARPALCVPPELSLEQAVAHAEAIGAGVIVVCDQHGRAAAIVPDPVPTQLPRAQWAGQPVSACARSLPAAPALPLRISGPDLLRVVSAHPAAHYLMLDDAGRVVRVLALRDLDRAVGF